MNGSTISTADQVEILKIFGSLDSNDAEAVLEAVDSMPENAQTALYTDINIEQTTITGEDQRELLEIMDAALRAVDELPDSIYSLVRPSIDMDRIMEIGLLLVGFYVLSLVLSAVQGWIMSTVTQRVSRQMRSDISRKINRLPMWYYNRTTTGDVLSRVTNDVDTISQSLNQSIGNLVSAVVLFLGSLFMMLITDGWMTLTAVVSSLLGFVLMFLIMGRNQKYFTRQQRHLGRLNGHIEEIYAGHTVVKAYNGEEEAQETFDRMNEDLVNSNFRAQSLSGMMMPLMNFIGNFGYVEFDHVKFGYEDSDHVVIHDFSAKAEPGQKIAIVGPTGAGKTTLVNLLMRFHEIQDGEIRIDGISTKEMTREAVHSMFCTVLQDTWLFEGTVRENLIYCSENASDAKMEEACRAVGLDHFIRTLPRGYDTVLNDQVSLSQGQKQQLTIARAMIADKPMLILDEATSSVDTRTEQQIQAAMDKLMENRTSFVIAHRLSTIKNSDLILVLKDGDVIESGTHEELLAKKGFYADLYNSQFERSTDMPA